MRVLIAALGGLAVGRVAWTMLRGVLAHPALQRENYRGHRVPTAGGVILVLSLLVVEAARAVVDSTSGGPSVAGAARAATLVTVTGFALLGFVDDLLGSRDARGFRGHVAALRAGRLTTGGTKLLGGGAVALVACAMASRSGSTLWLLADAGLVALAANLGNLLDAAPGRVIKVSTVAGAALVAATGAPAALAGAAAVGGAALAVLPEDLGENLMLGDTGANAMGGALGLGVVLACDERTRVIVLIVVAAANLASEVVSFSRVIDAVPPLRLLDRAGRRRR
jgi:UDP-N-acetylmuramyl pentapeptide phosphotransferase/UDP-N-acetylglucosamine-1-phosphate transferase